MALLISAPTPPSSLKISFPHFVPGVKIPIQVKKRTYSCTRIGAVIMAAADGAQIDKPTKLVTFLGKGGSGKTTSAVFAAQVHYCF